ncbi:hypothetical protein ACFFRR_008009 [Megaselia abdita]
MDKGTQTSQEDFMKSDGFDFDRLRTIHNDIDLMNYEVMLKQCRLCLDDNPYFSSVLRKEPTAEDVRSSFAFLANNLDFAVQSWCEKCKQKLGTLLYGLIHLSNTEKIFLRLQKSAKEYHEAEARKKIQQEEEKQKGMKVLRSESVYKAFRKLQQQTADKGETETIDGESNENTQQPRRKRVYKGKDIQALKEEEKRYFEKYNKGCDDGVWESNLICNDNDTCGIVLRRSTRSKSVYVPKGDDNDTEKDSNSIPTSTSRLRRRKSMFVSKVRKDCTIRKRRRTEDGVSQTTVKRKRQTKNICICCEHTPLSASRKKSNTKPRKKVAKPLPHSIQKENENCERVNVEETFRIDGIDFYEYYPSEEEEWEPEEDLDVIWTIGYSSAGNAAKHKRRYSSLQDDHTYHKSSREEEGERCFE